MNNLQSLLSKSDNNQPTPAPKQHNEDAEILISVKIPVELDEWIRDFQYSVAAETGNFKFSYKDAICKIIREYRTKQKTINPRPESIRSSERKKRR